VLRRALTRSRRGVVRRARQRGRALAGLKPRAHMLHPGKTGGTAIKAALEPVRTSGRYALQLHPHPTVLRDVPREEKVFFVLRDPAERFVSSFNSRLRQGLPRYRIAWTPEEQTAFEEFATADELARALCSEDDARRARAFCAMSSILHVRDSYWRWLGHGQMLQRRADDLLAVVWLPDLGTAFPRLRTLLGLPDSVVLPTDEVGAHRSPTDMDRSLSDQALANLRWWYSRDYACIEMCAQMDCFIGASWSSALAPPAAPVRA
jgi:hypothetical protein